MNNNVINIYVTGRNIAGVLENTPSPAGLKVSFRIFTLEHGAKIRISSEAVNVFVLKKLPARLIDGAKYILCSKNPENLTPSDLTLLYDLWPEPLTPSLLKFYFLKLLERISAELANTSEETEHQKRIIEMARQDYLTGLATRWYLQEYIKKNQDERNVTCIYFDLDNFKAVNDTYGHQAGDRALAATAEMMQRDFSPDGFCARMGGDEFMIVLLGMRDASEVERKVNAFMAGLLEYYAGTKTMKALSVSAGVAQKTHGDDKTIDRLMHESDIALYAAKNSGRSRCRVYDPSMEEDREGQETSSGRNYYLVDYENVKSEGLNGIHKLDANNTVCIFYSKNADRISSELNLHLKESKAEIIYHRVEVGVKNALDFQLSSYLGEIITENAGGLRGQAKYFIVSKDNGFSSLISFWKEKNITVDVIADVSGKRVHEDTESIAKKVAELLGDNDAANNAAEIAGIITNCRTKMEINTALLKMFRNNAKVGEIYRAIKPLIANKRGK